MRPADPRGPGRQPVVTTAAGGALPGPAGDRLIMPRTRSFRLTGKMAYSYDAYSETVIASKSPFVVAGGVPRTRF